jgi:hypothetical protein
MVGMISPVDELTSSRYCSQWLSVKLWCHVWNSRGSKSVKGKIFIIIIYLFIYLQSLSDGATKLGVNFDGSQTGVS